MRTVLMLLMAAMIFAACAQETGEDPTVVADTAPFDTRPDVALTQMGATAIVIIGDGSIGMPTERLGPGPAVFTVQNTGTLLHTLTVQGEGQDAVSAGLHNPLEVGEESSLQIDLVPGDYVAWCSLHPDEPGERVEFTVEIP